jgi:hypothetical protein
MAVYESGERFGISLPIALLKGSKAKKITEKGISVKVHAVYWTSVIPNMLVCLYERYQHAHCSVLQIESKAHQK